MSTSDQPAPESGLKGWRRVEVEHPQRYREVERLHGRQQQGQGQTVSGPTLAESLNILQIPILTPGTFRPYQVLL